MTPGHAMLLAAGPGQRMHPLTEHTAKPLLPLGGRPLIDHALDHLARAGVNHVVVSTHWQAERVAAHLHARTGPPATAVRREPALLQTGGAVQAALAEGRLGDGQTPFFIVNGDIFWLDGPVPALTRLAHAFDPEAVDAVLLVHRSFLVVSEIGFGDFMLDKWGLITRRGEREVAPYVFGGIQIVSPNLFRHAPAPPFDIGLLWDRAIAAGRLRAVVHDGLWFQLSTPKNLAESETHLHDADPVTR